jgi:hypothetical protein
MSDYHSEIMNMRPKKTMSHFLKLEEMKAYILGYKEARHDAAEIVSHPMDDCRDNQKCPSCGDVLTYGQAKAEAKRMIDGAPREPE